MRDQEPLALTANVPMKDLAQLGLGLVQAAFALSAQVLARPVEVEIQHGHRRAERVRLAAVAAFGRPLERKRDGPGSPAEHPGLQIERVAGLGDSLRPAPWFGSWHD